MNINKTDAHQSFDYYREVITLGIARSVSAAYRERIAVYGTLELEVPSFVNALKKPAIFLTMIFLN